MLILFSTFYKNKKFMVIFRNFEMYYDFNCKKENLDEKTLSILKNLPSLDGIPGERFWILKIKGNIVAPEKGDLLITWPSGQVGEQLIKLYCKELQERSYPPSKTHICVEIGYFTNIKVLSPNKHEKLIYLIKEFEHSNNYPKRNLV